MKIVPPLFCQGSRLRPGVYGVDAPELLCPRIKARTSEPKAKAEDLTSEAKDMQTWPRGQGRGFEDYTSDIPQK